MRVLVFPRDPNPYQRLLYGEMAKRGAHPFYLGQLTPSRTLNLLLLPLELACQRSRGGRVLHLHWVFAFTLPGAQRFPALRHVAAVWFRIWLRSARLLGVHVVWTAHNVLPHQPVFPDDAATRRFLVARSDLVLAHSPATLADLAKLGAVPARSALVRHGPFAPPVPAASLRRPGSGSDGYRQFLFFGQVEEYKGVEDLLRAFASLPGNVPAQLTVAGECGDPGLRSRLWELAGQCGGRAVLRLEHVPDAAVTPLIAAADAVVLPFRRVTTSGSAMLAMTHGRPLIVPDLPALTDLPARAVVRYDGTCPGLTAALADVARADPGHLAAMSAAALACSAETSWRDIAAATLAEMTSLLAGPLSRKPRPYAAAAR